jgi:hypothetical protein
MTSVPLSDLKVSDLVSLQEAASLTGWSRTQIRLGAEKGQIVFYKLPNGGRAFLRSSVLAYVPPSTGLGKGRGRPAASNARQK